MWLRLGWLAGPEGQIASYQLSAWMTVEAETCTVVQAWPGCLQNATKAASMYGNENTHATFRSTGFRVVKPTGVPPRADCAQQKWSKHLAAVLENTAAVLFNGTPVAQPIQADQLEKLVHFLRLPSGVPGPDLAAWPVSWALE